MKLVAENSPLPRLLAWPLLLMLLGALLAVKLYPDLILGLSHCPLRDITGLPCPTCGGTHSAAAVAAGRWVEALRANPVVVLGGAVFVVWALYCVAATILPTLRRSLWLDPREKKAARWLAAFFLVFAWGWQIWRVYGQAG